jgi:hypothetical protein
VNARHMAITIGIRTDLVKSLISAELDLTRAGLRVRRKARNGGNFVWRMAYRPSMPH